MDKQHKPKIFIIDDAENWLNTFSDVLVDEFHIVSSHSYEDAKAVLENSREPFAAAVIDIRLDHLDEANQDGLSLAKQIKKVSPNTSIVVVTGHASLKTMHEAFTGIDVSDYVQKVPPEKLFSPPDFRKTIREAVDLYRWKQEYSPYETLPDRIEQLTFTQKEIADNERAMVLKSLAEDIIHSMNNAIGRIPSRISLIKNLLISDGHQSEIERQLDEILKDARLSMQEARMLFNLSTQWENIEIGELVNTVISDIEPYTPPEIEFLIAIEMPSMAHAIRTQLRIALKNIIDNSIGAMSGAGKIEIITTGISDENGKYIQIDISDTGPGISTDKIDTIFDLGVSISERGLGYGLWRCKNIIEKHGGSIELTRSSSDGTTFTIRLPQA